MSLLEVGDLSDRAAAGELALQKNANVTFVDEQASARWTNVDIL